MPEIYLHLQNKSVSLFFSLPKKISIQDFMDNPEEVEHFDVDVSILHFGCSRNWDFSCNNAFEMIIDIDEFTKNFLSEDYVSGLRIKYPRNNLKRIENAIYFRLSSNTFKNFVKLITKSNTTNISIETLRDEELSLHSDDTHSKYPLNYKFPVSFLSENVQKSLKLKKKNNENDENTKKKLKPAHKVYDRILFDSNIEKSSVIIGYIDRFNGLKEVQFSQFVTLKNERFYNTSVPFHRIRYFKYNNDIIWDRKKKLNLITSTVNKY